MGRKNKKKKKRAPGVPAKTLIALIDPVPESCNDGRIRSCARGTVRTTYNSDGSFLVSLDLNFDGDTTVEEEQGSLKLRTELRARTYY